jgi:hypothetical protein
MIAKPDFTRQLAVVLCIVILILIILLVLYYNSTKNIVDITKEVFTKKSHRKISKKGEKDLIPLKDCDQKNSLALFNDFEENILNQEIMNNNLVESYILYIYFESTYGNQMWLSNFNSEKTILRRGKFKISYSPSKNNLIVTIPIKKLGIHSSNNQEEKFNLNDSEEKIIVNKVKLQKWLQIGIVINGRSVDIYIDKRLRKNQILDNVPILSNEKIILGEARNNPNCYIGKIEYSPLEIKPDELKALYFKNMRSFKINPLLRECVKYNNHMLNTFSFSPTNS